MRLQRIRSAWLFDSDQFAGVDLPANDRAAADAKFLAVWEGNGGGSFCRNNGFELHGMNHTGNTILRQYEIVRPEVCKVVGADCN